MKVVFLFESIYAHCARMSVSISLISVAMKILEPYSAEWLETIQVFVIDLWKEHTPWPFNQAPRAYSFMVKHETIWKFTFHSTAPTLVHQSQMAATAPFVAR